MPKITQSKPKVKKKKKKKKKKKAAAAAVVLDTSVIRASFLKASSEAGFATVEELFAKFDSGASTGDLSLREFVAGARSCGLPLGTVSDDALVALFQSIDTAGGDGSGDGRISTPEFLAFIHPAPEADAAQIISAKFMQAATDAGFATIEELFAKLETSGDGQFNLREFVAGARACAMSAATVSDDELIELFGFIDATHGDGDGGMSDGQMSVTEFSAFVRSHTGGAAAVVVAPVPVVAAPVVERKRTFAEEREWRSAQAQCMLAAGLITAEEHAEVATKLAAWGENKTKKRTKKRMLKRRDGRDDIGSTNSSAAAEREAAAALATVEAEAAELAAKQRKEIDVLLRTRMDVARSEADDAFGLDEVDEFLSKVGDWQPSVLATEQVFASIAHKITEEQLDAALGDTQLLWPRNSSNAAAMASKMLQRPSTPRALKSEAERIRIEGAPDVPLRGSAERIAATKLRHCADDLAPAAMVIEPLHLMCSSLRALSSDAKRAADAGDAVGETLHKMCTHLARTVPLIAALADATPAMDRLAEMDVEQAELDAEIVNVRRVTDEAEVKAARSAAKRPKSLPPPAALAGPKEDHILAPAIRTSFTLAMTDAGFTTVEELFEAFDSHDGGGSLSMREFVAGARSCGLSVDIVADEDLVNLFTFIDSQHGGEGASDGLLSIEEFVYFIHGDDSEGEGGPDGPEFVRGSAAVETQTGFGAPTNAEVLALVEARFAASEARSLLLSQARVNTQFELMHRAPAIVKEIEQAAEEPNAVLGKVHGGLDTITAIRRQSNSEWRVAHRESRAIDRTLGVEHQSLIDERDALEESIRASLEAYADRNRRIRMLEHRRRVLGEQQERWKRRKGESERAADDVATRLEECERLFTQRIGFIRRSKEIIANAVGVASSLAAQRLQNIAKQEEEFHAERVRMHDALFPVLEGLHVHMVRQRGIATANLAAIAPGANSSAIIVSADLDTAADEVKRLDAEIVSLGARSKRVAWRAAPSFRVVAAKEAREAAASMAALGPDEIAEQQASAEAAIARAATVAAAAKSSSGADSSRTSAKKGAKTSGRSSRAARKQPAGQPSNEKGKTSFKKKKAAVELAKPAAPPSVLHLSWIKTQADIVLAYPELDAIGAQLRAFATVCETWAPKPVGAGITVSNETRTIAMKSGQHKAPPVHASPAFAQSTLFRLVVANPTKGFRIGVCDAHWNGWQKSVPAIAGPTWFATAKGVLKRGSVGDGGDEISAPTTKWSVTLSGMKSVELEVRVDLERQVVSFAVGAKTAELSGIPKHCRLFVSFGDADENRKVVEKAAAGSESPPTRGGKKTKTKASKGGSSGGGAASSVTIVGVQPFEDTLVLRSAKVAREAPPPVEMSKHALGAAVSRRFLEKAEAQGFEDVCDLFAYFDSDSDGSLSLREFVADCRQCGIAGSVITDDALQELFRWVDREHGGIGSESAMLDGRISIGEFVSFIESNGVGGASIAEPEEGEDDVMVEVHVAKPLSIGGVLRGQVKAGVVPEFQIRALFDTLPAWAHVRLPYDSDAADGLYKSRVSASHAAKHGAVAAESAARAAQAATRMATAQWEGVAVANAAAAAAAQAADEASGNSAFVSTVSVAIGIAKAASRAATAKAHEAIEVADEVFRRAGRIDDFLRAHTSAVLALTVLADGRIASGGTHPENTVKLWDHDLRKNAWTTGSSLDGNADSIQCMAALRDGSLATAGWDKKIHVWRLAQDKLAYAVGDAIEANYKAKGKWFAATVLSVNDGGGESGSYDLKYFDGDVENSVDAARVRPVVGGAKPQAGHVVLEGHSETVWGICELADGRIASCSADRTVKIWAIGSDSATCTATLSGHEHWVTCIAQLDDGRIATGSYDETIRIWTLPQLNPEFVLPGPAAGAKCVAVLKGHQTVVRTLCTRPGGLIVSGGYDKTVRVWRVGARSGKLLRTMTGHGDWVNGIVALGGARELVVTSSEDKTLRVWSLKKGKCIAVLNGHSRGVVGVALLASGSVVSSSRDKLLCVWSPLHWEVNQTAASGGAAGRGSSSAAEVPAATTPAKKKMKKSGDGSPMVRKKKKGKGGGKTKKTKKKKITALEAASSSAMGPATLVSSPRLS